MFGFISKKEYNQLLKDCERLQRQNRGRVNVYEYYGKITKEYENEIKELKNEITYLNTEVLRLKSEK